MRGPPPSKGKQSCGKTTTGGDGVRNSTVPAVRHVVGGPIITQTLPSGAGATTSAGARTSAEAATTPAIAEVSGSELTRIGVLLDPFSPRGGRVLNATDVMAQEYGPVLCQKCGPIRRWSRVRRSVPTFI